jgi:hypothetical protein
VSGPADKKDEDTGKRRPRESGTARGDLPRRLGEVLTPTLDRLAGGDEARAYAAWARAVGDPVTGGTRPKAFRRGQLTIECASSVWANELTYLGPRILRRMDEVAPGHPVKRFRFVLGRLPAPAPADEASVGAAPAPRRAASGGGEASVTEGSGASSGQGSGGPTAKEESRQQRPAPTAQEAARAQAEGVGDERLRAAIEAALRASSEEPPGASGDGTLSG